MRVVQLINGAKRCVALVEEPHLRPLSDVDSLYELALRAARSDTSLVSLIEHLVTTDRLAYDPVYDGASTWRLLPPIDHPGEPSRCLVSGTGLTHLGSAANRDAMHAAQAPLTDSMKMFRAGLEGGRPGPGSVGTPPEWFYKGCGTSLRTHGDALDIPWHSEDGGEEAEIAGVYVIDDRGQPRRVGMAAGNEFSDHRFERTNYLHLAGSKLRACAIGPELVLDPDFRSVRGHIAIERGGRTVWEKEIMTGEEAMCHSLGNLEHHHFKFEAHRRPGDVHVHFFGAHSLSFGDGIKLVNDDVMVIRFDGFGRPLRNRVAVAASSATPVVVQPLS